MPFMDGTGPWGEGPMTGRGMGYCAGYARPGYPPATGRRWFGLGRGFGRGLGRGLGRGFGRGRGFGMGRGLGRGWGRGWSQGGYWDAPYAPQMTRDDEVGFLKEEADAVKTQLEEIEARIKEIENAQT